MPPPPFDDALPESFFAALYPDLAPSHAPGEGAPAAHAWQASLIEHSPDAMVVIDRQLRCVLANAAARRWCAPDGDLPPLPTGWNELLPPPLAEALLPHLACALRGQPSQADLTLPHPDHGPRPVRVLAQPAQGPGSAERVFLYLQELVQAPPTRLPPPAPTPPDLAAPPQRMPTSG